MDLDGGVAVRLASRCLEPSGRLRSYALWDTAARGALIVDLVVAGRVTLTEDSVVVDETRTGFEPADRLLAAMAVEPERSLDWWFDHGGLGLQDVADACVTSGRWAVRPVVFGRRYTDLDRAVSDGSTAVTAAVLAIATAAGAGGRWPRPVPEEALVATGTLRWICQAVTDHLEVAHRRNRLAAGAADGGPVYWV